MASGDQRIHLRKLLRIIRVVGAAEDGLLSHPISSETSRIAIFNFWISALGCWLPIVPIALNYSTCSTDILDFQWKTLEETKNQALPFPSLPSLEIIQVDVDDGRILGLLVGLIVGLSPHLLRHTDNTSPCWKINKKNLKTPIYQYLYKKEKKLKFLTHTKTKKQRPQHPQHASMSVGASNQASIFFTRRAKVRGSL